MQALLGLAARQGHQLRIQASGPDAARAVAERALAAAKTELEAFRKAQQSDADATRPHVQAIAEMGWKVHCWHEPAIGPIDWRGWEFLSWLVVGGQSGGDEGFDIQWARDAITWGAANHVPVKIKQIGSNAYGMVQPEGYDRPYRTEIKIPNDRRGSNWDEWPADIRVRQMPNGFIHV